MKIVSSFVFLVLGLSSYGVFAGCAGLFCGDVYVDKLYVTANNLIYVGTSGNEANLSCDAESDVYVTLNPQESQNSKEIYSTLLTAQTANKTVMIRVNEGSVGCSIYYITLDKQ